MIHLAPGLPGKTVRLQKALGCTWLTPVNRGLYEKACGSKADPTTFSTIHGFKLMQRIKLGTNHPAFLHLHHLIIGTVELIEQTADAVGAG